jgi:GH24 family phage-related lysozyme (muramidase)
MLYKGDLIGACNQLPRWDKASVGGIMVSLPGLSKRRAAERDLCLTGAA